MKHRAGNLRGGICYDFGHEQYRVLKVYITGINKTKVNWKSIVFTIKMSPIMMKSLKMAEGN